MGKKPTLETLAAQMERSFIALAEDISRLPSKDDVRTTIHAEVPGIVREEIQDIRQEVASIGKDLDLLSAKVDNITGLPKEIDHALERIASIEKHLGISNEIAA